MLKKVATLTIPALIFFGTLYLLLRVYDGQKTVKINDRFRNYHNTYNIRPDLIRIPEPRSFNATAAGTVDVKKTRNGKVIFETRYVLNPFGMREVALKNSGKASGHLILGGCSFTYGEGLFQEDTLSQKLEDKSEQIENYNLGTGGGGLHTLFHFFSLVEMKEYVHEDSGIFVYLFISDHMNRWFARPDYLNWAPQYHPRYAVENNDVVFKGLVKDTKIFEEHEKVKALGIGESYLRLQNALKARDVWTKEEVMEFVFAVNILKKRYQSLFPEGKFVFLTHAHAGINSETSVLLKEALKHYKIELWDGSSEFENYLSSKNIKERDFFIPGDGHPNGRFNDYFADYILSKIGQL